MPVLYFKEFILKNVYFIEGLEMFVLLKLELYTGTAVSEDLYFKSAPRNVVSAVCNAVTTAENVNNFH